MENAIFVISCAVGVVLVGAVIVGTIRLINKTKFYNPDHDLNDIERFFDSDED